MLKFRWVAITAIAAAAACSGNSSTGYGGNPPPPPPPPPPPSGGHSTTITVSNNTFSPTPDTISAGTITFTWAAGAITHNVTWDTGPAPLPAGSGDRMAGDANFQASLVAGDYTYHCTHHGGMNGTIHVN
jgi:plastocyanin